jgi:cell division protein FtsQ
MWHDVKLMNNTANALFRMVLFILMMSGVWWVIQRPMFTLASIRVEGMSSQALKHVNALTIKNSAIPRIRGNFLRRIWMQYAVLKAFHG